MYNSLLNTVLMSFNDCSKRIVDMRLMSEHKYGLRVASKPGWQEIFKKLGEAAVRIELLQNKPNSALHININDPMSSSSKGRKRSLLY